MTNVFAKLQKGLWNLSAEERKAVYQDLRQALGLKETEPLLPLPEQALKAMARRGTELMMQAMASHPATQMLANAEILEATFLQYGLPPADEFLDSHIGPSRQLAQAGLPGLYIHALMTTRGLECTLQAAREVLTPEQQALVLERFPRALFLRHALLQEGTLDAAKA
jgi:hypothetical protein